MISESKIPDRVENTEGKLKTNLLNIVKEKVKETKKSILFQSLFKSGPSSVFKFHFTLYYRI